MSERTSTTRQHVVRWTPRARPLVATLVLGLALAVAACGRGTPVGSASAPHATATPTATATPPPTATATPSPAPPSACQQFLRYGGASHRVGDLLIAGFYLGLPSRKMADATPLQPQLFPDPKDRALINSRFPPQPLTNPMEKGGGFGLILCDASTTQSFEIEGVTFGIAQFTPYTGRVQSWNLCDGYYSRSVPGGATGYGCGYSFQADELLHVAFSTAAAGSVASAIQVGFDPPTATPSGRYGPLPATLGPGQDMVFFVTAKLPSTPGTYAF
ncbi:MAG TPA: hypothetical protein VE258_11780, partial [Ktedonobacterales bacterium]|nr:hypothetical protein [Ktedonobacterales bacterium]